MTRLSDTARFTLRHARTGGPSCCDCRSGPLPRPATQGDCPDGWLAGVSTGFSGNDGGAVVIPSVMGPCRFFQQAGRTHPHSDCGGEVLPERDPAAKACPVPPRAGQAAFLFCLAVPSRSPAQTTQGDRPDGRLGGVSDPFTFYRDGVMPWEA